MNQPDQQGEEQHIIHVDTSKLRSIPESAISPSTATDQPKDETWHQHFVGGSPVAVCCCSDGNHFPRDWMHQQDANRMAADLQAAREALGKEQALTMRFYMGTETRTDRLNLDARLDAKEGAGK